MRPWFETVTDFAERADVVRRRRHGVIEIIEGRFHRLRLRPFPKLGTLANVYLSGRWFHRHWTGNRCRLYYDQPRACPNFLALKYVVSTRDATLSTFHTALVVLDEIARLKRTDALLCDVANLRISDRLMARWGWQQHKPQRWHRNYIKRFYGVYPSECGLRIADCRLALQSTISVDTSVHLPSHSSSATKAFMNGA
ncbi:MAG TPA: hypothetical protein VGX76_19125 [Pirellulales bacterium]|jgi:hypothetical protein|nr:hypothetical protein [Pirellulales bacterium]